jgi:hypothetical protein
MKKKTVCIDFDGCIAQCTDTFQEDVFGEPVEGAKEAMEVLRSHGYILIIFTTRSATDALKAWLKEHKIPYDAINENPSQPAGANPGKPIADVYIDDRAVTFRGDWSWTIREVADFNPYASRKRDLKKEYENSFNEYVKMAKERSKILCR